MFDGKAFGEQIVGIVKGHMERSLAPLNARLDAFEKMIADMPNPKNGEPGKSVTLDDVAPMIKGEIEKATADVPRAIAQTVEDEIAKLPPAVDGRDADPELIKQMVADAIAALPPAEKGKDADPVEVASLVTQEAERILAGWERPKDGQDGAPGEKGADGVPGRDGKDGIDAVDVMIDREGGLVFTMADGRMKNVGLVVGKDGEAGLNGKDGAPGINGKDGLDGVGFDDMDLEIDEEGAMIKFVKGDAVKQFRIPVPIDRGVFREGTQYRKGDGVSFGGSWFIAQEDTGEKPENGKGWRLAVKRGRDGKDGELKAPRESKPVKVG